MTHLSKDVSAQLHGYVWFGQNFEARKRGVGFFVREELRDLHVEAARLGLTEDDR